MKTDVSAQSEVGKMDKKTIGKFGRMDVLGNNICWTEYKANIDEVSNVR
jgi:hypothetical protein